jgi:site-specific DNA-methyltransferase (adenine-specific)
MTESVLETIRSNKVYSFDWTIEEAELLYKRNSFNDKIIFEDCIEGMKEIPKASIDLIIADPPFGIKFDGKGSQYNRKKNLVIENYQEILSNYNEFSSQWIDQLPRIMKDSGSAYIFSGWNNLKDILIAIDNSKLTVLNHNIWKYQFGVYTMKKFVSSHYHVLLVIKNPKKYFFNKIEHYPEDVWTIPRKYMKGQEKNGTKLPEKLVEKLINFSSKPGDLILDPFMGNGTTAICAKSMFRHYLGFETNEKMKSIIRNNLELIRNGNYYFKDQQ